MQAFINESCQACKPFGAHFDYNLADDDHKHTQNLYKGMFLYKCLSMQNVLGVGKNGVKNVPAKLAWTALNLRQMSPNLNQSLKSNENIRHGEMPYYHLLQILY